MRKVQFKADDLKLGFTKATGFVWADEKGIQFEYQVSDNILSILKSKVTEVTLTYDQVEEITFQKPWIGGGKLRIQLSSLKNVGKIPFLKDTIIIIPVKRQQKDNAENFAVDAQYELSNHRLNRLDGYN